MPTQRATTGKASGQQGKGTRNPGPATVIVILASLLFFLAFLIYRSFSAPTTTTVQTQPQVDAPEKYGLPFGAPPEAVEMRKKQLTGAAHPMAGQ